LSPTIRNGIEKNIHGRPLGLNPIRLIDTAALSAVF
jgi:hypothetical protein